MCVCICMLSYSEKWKINVKITSICYGLYYSEVICILCVTWQTWTSSAVIWRMVKPSLQRLYTLYALHGCRVIGTCTKVDKQHFIFKEKHIMIPVISSWGSRINKSRVVEKNVLVLSQSPSGVMLGRSGAMWSACGHWLNTDVIDRHCPIMFSVHLVISMWHVICLQHFARASSEQSRSICSAHRSRDLGDLRIITIIWYFVGHSSLLKCT